MFPIIQSDRCLNLNLSGRIKLITLFIAKRTAYQKSFLDNDSWHPYYSKTCYSKIISWLAENNWIMQDRIEDRADSHKFSNEQKELMLIPNRSAMKKIFQ